MKGEGQARPALPAGQRALDHFPRFGAPSYAARLPSQIAPDFTLEISVAGFACAPITKADLEQLPRVDCVADFHCVATWTAPGLRWSGYAFRDVVEQLLRPRIPAAAFGNYVEFKGLDGYRICILLADLLGPDVLLADRLNDAQLPLEHGAPLRLVVPSLYGYKNIKHLSAIHLRPDYRRTSVERTTRAHPRGRVALEERGVYLPGPFYRVVYRTLLPAIRWLYRRALPGKT